MFAAAAGRSTLIVLFTDLVGSTELRSRLGEGAAETVRRKHDRLVADAIEGNRGYVVKHLGDGVMATFTGASDAVAAAIRIQQAIDRHNRSEKNAVLLEVRIGLSAGDVTVEGEDCFGTPVIEASRLCAAARGGQILSTEVVRLLAGSAAGHDFTPVGGLKLKGLPAPVGVCEVAWEPLPVPMVPLPSFLMGVGRIFVGRDEPLGRLTRLWKEAAAGKRQVALTAGEPGIGKTRLAAQLAQILHAEGALVLGGRCDEDMGVPYQPLVEALRHYVNHAPELRLGRYGGELVRLVPELADTVPGLAPPLRSDPETERYRLFDAVAAWLAHLSLETPLLLVVDDLHWAAKPTLLLLRHVLRFREPLRMLVVATYRDDELRRGHPLSEVLPDLRRLEGVERFPLVGLDQAAVTAFIEAAAGHALPEEDQELSQRVWLETEGNPFFVAELLRHLTETGAVERRDGRWVVTAPLEELGIPEGVRDVVSRRLSRLSDAANRALAVASVVGLEFEPAIVQTAGDFGENALVGALEEAVAARLLGEVPSATHYRFSHALVKATLYDELSAARRVVLHRRVAEAVEALHAAALDDYLPDLAHHWARASAPSAETVRAIAYAARAGDRALAQLAHHEAVVYYRQALELLDVVEGPSYEGARLELLISLGEAQRRSGEPVYRQTLLDAADLAQRRGDATALARAALANTRGNIYSAALEVDMERVAVLEAALETIDRDDLAVRTRLLANLALELAWVSDRNRRMELSEEALVSARRLGAPDILAHVLLARDFTIAAPDNLVERFANTGELLELGRVLGDPVLASRAWVLRFRAAMELADVEEANHCLAANEALVTDLGQPALAWPVLVQRAGLLLLRGEIAAADEALLAAYERGVAVGEPDAPVYLWAGQTLVRLEQGRIGELKDTTRRYLERTGNPAVQVTLAVTYAETDELEEAHGVYGEMAESGFAIPFDFLWLRAVTDLAYLCARLGDAGRAPILHGMLEPYADRVVTIAQGSLVTGSVTLYLGMLATTLGNFDEAEGRFAAAADTHTRIGARIWLARTRLEWARMLLARREPGDAERARHLLSQALVTARELGATTVERRAVALLT
jgi:class 3 adenylate cyclase